LTEGAGFAMAALVSLVAGVATVIVFAAGVKERVAAAGY